MHLDPLCPLVQPCLTFFFPLIVDEPNNNISWRKALLSLLRGCIYDENHVHYWSPSSRELDYMKHTLNFCSTLAQPHDLNIVLRDMVSTCAWTFSVSILFVWYTWPRAPICAAAVLFRKISHHVLICSVNTPQVMTRTPSCLIEVAL
jgi:hypothetical protein